MPLPSQYRPHYSDFYHCHLVLLGFHFIYMELFTMYFLKNFLLMYNIVKYTDLKWQYSESLYISSTPEDSLLPLLS